MYPVVANLRVARDRIAAGWCQGALARNDKGFGVSLEDPSAERFCVIGALVLDDHNSGSFGRGLEVDYLSNALDILLGRPWPITVWSFNDTSTRTQAEVLELYDLAILLAEIQEPFVND